MTVIDITSLLTQRRQDAEEEARNKRLAVDELEKYLQLQQEEKQNRRWREDVKSRHPRQFAKVKARHYWSPEVLEKVGLRGCFPTLVWNWLVTKVDQVGVVAEVIPATCKQPELYKVTFTNAGGIKKTRLVPEGSLFFLTQRNITSLNTAKVLSPVGNSKRAG